MGPSIVAHPFFRSRMLIHPQFDPVAIKLGPVAVHWYGLMYLVGFALLWGAGRYPIARAPGQGLQGVWSQPVVVDLSPGVPVSMKSWASKCERVGCRDPTACTTASSLRP